VLHALFLRVANENVTKVRYGHSFGCFTGYRAPLAAREDGQHIKQPVSLENKRPTVNWPIQYSLPGYEFESHAYIATNSIASGCANGSA
jgi:hypothetical protein